MKNIHILPTDKPSRLWTNNLRRRLELDEFPEQHPNQIAKHIYLTNDEEIKEGDWFIRDGSIHKCFRVHKTDIEFLTSIDSVYCGSNTFWSKEFCKKIILTTDTDLIKDGVQAIDDTFLEWFVKNPSCESVEVQKWSSLAECGYSYHIIIPKQTDWKDSTKALMVAYGDNPKDFPYEEPKQIKCYCGHTTYCDCSPLEEQKQHLINIMKADEELGLYEEPKQETLEEAAENYAHNYFNMHETNNYKALKAGFEKGAKWQQERMYSEEDMIAFYNFIENHQLRKFGDVWKRITNNPNDKPLNFESVDDNYIIEWFEQFKKK